MYTLSVLLKAYFQFQVSAVALEQVFFSILQTLVEKVVIASISPCIALPPEMENRSRRTFDGIDVPEEFVLATN